MIPVPGLFQFLIGRLDTAAAEAGGVEIYPFQFLIGRLDTEEIRYNFGNRIPFQFLIGRLDTGKTASGSGPSASCFNSS